MHTTFAAPPSSSSSSLSLKGTDQMASELLNVQQLLASPDASLLHNTTTHGAHLHSDNFFSLFFFFQTAPRNPPHRDSRVLYTRSSPSDGGLSYLGIC